MLASTMSCPVPASAAQEYFSWYTRSWPLPFRFVALCAYCPVEETILFGRQCHKESTIYRAEERSRALLMFLLIQLLRLQGMSVFYDFL
jgi:hypothetical protein